MVMKGLAFPSAWEWRVTDQISGVDVHPLSLGDLVTAKQASNRAKDQNDLAHLPTPESD
ncbi:MAG: hypothetical protein DVB23_003213 [Verrucomicrobia bacterium]|jgi:hypothetical protein|nr:MAG: hypothetical protein DVB23_003213 [Verrucomicrobiota bacterium]